MKRIRKGLVIFAALLVLPLLRTSAQQIQIPSEAPAGSDNRTNGHISQADYEKISAHLDISIIGHITDKNSGVNLVDKSGNSVKMKAQGWDALLSW